jgi:hypothetical protein
MKLQSLIFSSLIISLYVFTSCSGSTSKSGDNVIAKTDTGINTTSSGIEGEWNLVSDNLKGNVSDNEVKQFKMFHNGFFSLMMQDSAGKWIGAAGTYTLDGNRYKETFTYCTVPEYVGATDWQEYELKDDTLYFKGFSKLTFADGKDMTAAFPAFEEKRIRAKSINQ